MLQHLVSHTQSAKKQSTRTTQTLKLKTRNAQTPLTELRGRHHLRHHTTRHCLRNRLQLIKPPELLFLVQTLELRLKLRLKFSEPRNLLCPQLLQLVH